MTLEKISANLERWQSLVTRRKIALDKAEAKKEKWDRQVNRLTLQINKLKEKIGKANPYVRYYKREREEGGDDTQNNHKD